MNTQLCLGKLEVCVGTLLQNYDQITRSKSLGGMHVLTNLMNVCSTVT